MERSPSPPAEAAALVMRPGAVLSEAAARAVLRALSGLDVARGGPWSCTPALWQRYDRPFNAPDGSPGDARLVGTLAVVYGTPSRYEITIHRVGVTAHGSVAGWSVQSLCDDALQHAGLTLQACVRAPGGVPAQPDPFRRPPR